MDILQRVTGSDSEEGSRRKRRAIAQGQRACNPCRARKVRCSYQLPCQTCVDRELPQLCVYDAPQKRTSAASSIAAPSPSPSFASPATTFSPATAFSPGFPAPPHLTTAWAPSKSDWEQLVAKIDKIEYGLQSVRRDIAARSSSQSKRSAREQDDESPVPDESASDEASLPARDGVHSRHPVTGEHVFLGPNSVPAMAMALSQQGGNDSTVRDLLDKSVLPIFTLENESTTYPFVDLWGLPHASPVRIEKLCAMLPSDSDCLQCVRQYRDTAHVLFPGIVNMQQFEVEVTRFLITRTSQGADTDKPILTEQGVYGKSVHWLGLLFSCLASGYQGSSNSSRRERQLTSQVYVCCAYECLRIVNYLSCCQLDDIQNLLVLTNVISNSMNAGVAWVLLGLTMRLAQGLGLHHEPSLQGLPAEERTLRQEIWSRIIWQDSLLSISYDRATPTANLTRWRTSQPARPPNGFSYTECMLQLCTVALEVVSSRLQPMSIQRKLQMIKERRKEVDIIAEQACAHLRDSSACALMKDHLEHWNWRMHCSHVVSELCKPVLAKRGSQNQDLKDEIASLRKVCIDALVDTVDAFLKLQNLTFFARTSWAAVHRSLGSALLLGILGVPAKCEAVKVMIDQLINVMSNLEFADSSEIPAPVTRAVDALQQLNAKDAEEGSQGDSPHAQMQRILWGADMRIPTENVADMFPGLSAEKPRDT
ncbi:C6 transcription factor [Podospora aff. communis PSN243]|uniref:C6 transcription factor n=1 Tax=Podospora aff. communis PSN243 TaxID=3040156 RepID=A0AAV9H3F3_9PEZI|nr:C6 transcription factor [Podospora aff. communis PSN243]